MVKIGNNSEFSALVFPRLFSRFFRNIDKSFFSELVKSKNDTFFNRCVCEDGLFCIFNSYVLDELKYLTSFDLYNFVNGSFCIDSTSGFDFSTEMKSNDLDVFEYVKYCKDNGLLRNDFSFVAKIDNQWDYAKDIGRLYLVADRNLIRDKILIDAIDQNLTTIENNISIMDYRNPVWSSSIDLGDTILFSFLYPYNKFEMVSAKYFHRFDRDVVC